MNEVNVKLNNVRLSFPALWEPKQGPDANSKSSYQAAFIMDKKSNAADIKAVQDAIATVVRETFKGKVPPKICLRDGYGPTVMFLNARSDRRPGVVGRDMSPLTKEDGKPYAGSYVNATIRVWAQDNQYGKRINAALRAVQFVKDGAPFGEGNIDVAQEFTALDEGVI